MEKTIERGPGAACSFGMLRKIRWPECLEKIFLVGFNQPMTGTIGPESLRVLAFHIPSEVTEGNYYVFGTRGIFNMPLDRLKFPSGLRELFLGHNFNQRIDSIAWPDGLQRLSMPGFNQPIHDVKWPPGLKTLEFIQPGEIERREFLDHLPWDRQEWGFDQPLETFLPMSLETLLLSDNFNQPLQSVTWPSKLAVLGLGAELLEDSLTAVQWPRTLRKIVSSDSGFDVRDAPPGCYVLRLDEYEGSEFEEDLSLGPFGELGGSDYECDY